jgi:hypothetical protein
MQGYVIMEYCNVYKHYNMQLQAELLVVILTIHIFNKLFCKISVYLQHESMDTGFFNKNDTVKSGISFLC